MIIQCNDNQQPITIIMMNGRLVIIHHQLVRQVLMIHKIFNFLQMNLRDYLKHNVNNLLYGDGLWRDDIWRKNYVDQLNANILNQNQYRRQNRYHRITRNDDGVLFRYNIRNRINTSTSSITGGDEMPTVEKETGIYIKDTFINYNTNSMLFGKKITPYAKKIIFEVIKFYKDSNIVSGGETKQKIIKYLNKVFEDKDLNYDKLMEKFNAKTNECLLAYMLIAYQNDDLDLMLRTTYTFGRVLPLTYKNEWFDNYRLNAYGNVLNMTMWQKWDCKGTFTVNEDPKPIDTTVTLSNPKRVLKFLVGSLRAFIIEHNLYPQNVLTLSNENENSNLSMQGGDVEQVIKGGDIMSVIDASYEHYPFYFGGAHGCDVFDMDNLSLNVDEITEFVNRYPSARVGYILNTATYRSGKGEHWMALELTKGKAKLICSQQSDFTVFHDGGKLRSSLQQNGYGEEWNNREIQTENYGCGTYAFISLMELLRFSDIDAAVNAIGVNMENLGKEVNKPSNVDIVREKLVGFTNK